LKVWIATGDETGCWDIENGQFGTDFLGVALALGTSKDWDSALQMPVGDKTALEIFSAPIATTLLSNTSPKDQKYHVMDVWKSVTRSHAQEDIQLDTTQSHPMFRQPDLLDFVMIPI